MHDEPLTRPARHMGESFLWLSDPGLSPGAWTSGGQINVMQQLAREEVWHCGRHDAYLVPREPPGPTTHGRVCDNLTAGSHSRLRISPSVTS